MLSTNLYDRSNPKEHREWLITCLKGLYIKASRKDLQDHFEIMVKIGDFNRKNPALKITNADISPEDNPWYDPNRGKYV